MSTKLDKPIENWLKEFDLPKLYKKNSDEALTETELHFLLYRMSRVKDMTVDPEAYQIILSLDKTRCSDFADALLKIFLDGGAESKHKWCMTLACVLGNEKLIETLKTKANSWIDNARPKMAEYALQAIVLNGSTKALRIVDYFARKYKTKNVGKTAALAFKSVAEFLGISQNDLSDSIIPDFDFEGLFKNFEVKDTSYRAFIDNDFKLVFLDEDNTLLKTLPKGISEILKNEFKSIAKEIKETVKAQTPKLENYLVSQRLWSFEKWQNLFLCNPIMFVYAVHLVWGVYDGENNLKYTFAVQEDQTLVNSEGEEINLDEENKIGIVHPLLMDDATINYWNEFFSDAGLTQLFPQLTRKTYRLKDDEKNLKILKSYSGIEVNAFTFIGNLEKKGWTRGSIGDGGTVLSYFKFFFEYNICVLLEQTGSLSIGYFENPAELGNLMFIKSNVNNFDKYYFDAPTNENDPRLISLGEIPPIIYSEIIADLEILKATAIRE